MIRSRSADAAPVRYVILFGVKHWCDYLAVALNSPDIQVEFVAFSLRHIVRLRSRRVICVRVGYRPGARTPRGRLFDLFWIAATRPANRRTYWIGTDVARAVAAAPDATPSSIRRDNIIAGASACGAPWFVDELKAIGISAHYLRFPYFLGETGDWAPWPSEFVISTYVPGNQPDFYGAQMVAAVASELPGATFFVYGGGAVPARPNIAELGWVDDLPEQLLRCVVHLRLTEHDAIAGTVREALSVGRYVVFGYDVPGAIKVDTHRPRSDRARTVETGGTIHARSLASEQSRNVGDERRRELSRRRRPERLDTASGCCAVAGRRVANKGSGAVNPPSSQDKPRVNLVSFESLARTTAAGNHIEAVRYALAESANVTVLGSESVTSWKRYWRASSGWLRSTRAHDTMYIRNHPFTVPLVILARLRRQRVVLEVNGPPDDILGTHATMRPLLPLFRLFLSISVRLSVGIVVPTQGMCDFVRSKGQPRPIHVIPAGFDDATFFPSRSDKPRSRDYVVFVGSPAAWQGVDTLIEARRLAAWPSAIELVLVGDFEHLDVSRAGATNSSALGVTKAGVIRPTAVAELLQGAIAALSPKTYQRGKDRTTGQAPLKVYEAMACGAPCIVTDVPVQNEIVSEHDCGTVVPVGDASAIAQAVASYRDDAALRARHSQNAWQASELFSWTTLAIATRLAVLPATKR